MSISRAPHLGAATAVVALAFASAMAFSTAPTPLYPLYRAAHDWSTLAITIAFACYAVGVAASLLLAGHLSDRYGRRRLLTIGLAVEIASCALLIASDRLDVVIAARALGGVGVGLISATATAFIGELAARTRLRRRPAAGLVIATTANLLGFAVGPVVSGVVADASHEPLRTPYLLFGALLVAALLAVRTVPETVPLPRTPAVYQPQRIRVPREGRGRYRSAALLAGACFAVLGLFSSVAPGFVARLLQDPSATTAGLVALAVFAASAVAQLALAGLRPRVQVVAGTTALLGGLATVTTAIWQASAAELVLGGVICGVGGGLVVRAAMATAVQLVPVAQRGESLAGVFLAGYIGLGLPVVGLGLLADAVDARTAVTVFAAATAIATVAGALGLLLPPRARPHGAPTFSAPGGRGYRSATRRYDLATPLDPSVATTAASVEQVRAAVRHASSSGLGVRMHSTGHGAAGAPPVHGELLLAVRMDEPVAVDVDRRTVRIPAGTRWGDVVAALGSSGLAVPHGSSPDVGAVGYLLQGGMSFYGRQHGVAANSVLSIELVLADGTTVTTDGAHDPELFWALRGGGGGFGVVTAVTVQAFPIGGVVTGSAFWPVADAAALGAAWERWTRTAPAAASTSFRIMNLPPLPGIPRALVGRTVVNVDGAVVASIPAAMAEAEQTAAGLLEPLRRIARPLLDSWRPGPASEVPRTHMDPPVPIHHSTDHLLLGELGPDGMAAFLRAAGTNSGDRTLASVELRQLGGAFATAPSGGGAVAALDGAFALLAAGMHSRRTPEHAIAARLLEVRSALAPWDTGFTAPTFVGAPGRPQRSFDTDTARRVQAVRRRVDPDGRFGRDVAAGARERAVPVAAG